MAATHEALLISTMQHRRTLLTQALERAGWPVRVYSDASEALAHVRAKPYSAIFCDEYLRGASAGGFLAWSRRLNPDVPFYVIALQGTETAIVGTGRPDRVIPFPPSEGDVPRPVTVSMWDGPPPDAGDLPLEGTTAVVGLADLIEMLAVTSASATIALAGGQRGRVYLDGGRVEHAVSVEDGLEVVGVRGLGFLLEAPDLPFQVLPYRTPSRRTVHVGTTAALTEAARIVDEARRDRGLLAAVAEACPDVLGVATGYLLNEEPSLARGDGAASFARATALLAALKPVAGSVTHLGVEADGAAHAVVAYGQGNVLAAHARRGRSLVLLSALVKAVRQHSR